MKKPLAKKIKTVLIVDDEALFLASLTEGLAAYKNEFSVVTAGNGRLAVEAFAQHDIQLVVTDLKMPVMDGFQLLAHLMTVHPNVPVVVMTAFGTPEIEGCINDFEAYGYLEKPIDFQFLADTIRQGISERSTGVLPENQFLSFLRLLHAEQKTCFLKIKSDGRKGTLYFSEGELLDATFNAVVGDEAAEEIINWRTAEVRIGNVLFKLRRRVKKPFAQFLAEAISRRQAASQFDGNSELLELPSSLLYDFDSIDDAPIDEPALETAAQTAVETGAENLAAATSAAIPAAIHATASAAADQTAEPTDNPQPNPPDFRKENILTMANNINDSLGELMQIDGAMAVALVDTRSGMALGAVGSGVNLDVAAAGNSEVVKSKLKVMGNLGLKDKIEDILISLSSQYHLIRPLVAQPNLFIYLVLNRANANLAMARFKLSDIEGRIEV